MRHGKRSNTGKCCAAALLFLLVAPAQETAPADARAITLSVQGEEGKPLSGVGVTLRRTLTPGGPRVRRPEWGGITAADGVVTFRPVPIGQYRLCAQAASVEWLNPCEWGAARPMVEITAAQKNTNSTLTLKRGASVQIRVDDPVGALAQYEGKSPGAHLLLGVNSDAGIFHQASVVVSRPERRQYSITIPFDTKVNLVVATSFYRLADATGTPFASNGAGVLAVTVPSGQPPPTLQLAITGRR